jgi:NAD(P)-dependent dehydrogenase (short-subunit alcohol dehydrogenase family)
MSKVWLVTGSASGLGRNIAEAVLVSGDRLVATARDPSRLEDLWRSTAIRFVPLASTWQMRMRLLQQCR